MGHHRNSLKTIAIEIESDTRQTAFGVFHGDEIDKPPDVGTHNWYTAEPKHVRIVVLLVAVSEDILLQFGDQSTEEIASVSTNKKPGELALGLGLVRTLNNARPATSRGSRTAGRRRSSASASPTR